MKRLYGVRKIEGQYWVVYQEAGHKKLVEPFGQDYLRAKISAYNGNRVVKEAELAFAGGER